MGYSTYMNWEKSDVTGGVDCPLIIGWEEIFSPGVDLADFADGVEMTAGPWADLGGRLDMTLRFTAVSATGLVGTIDAVGSTFTGEDEACNGEFPPLAFRAGVTD